MLILGNCRVYLKNKNFSWNKTNYELIRSIFFKKFLILSYNLIKCEGGVNSGKLQGLP
jgi:hypothetical protein